MMTQRSLKSALLTLLALVSHGVTPTTASVDYRYFVAGGTSAAISHGITTPIDVVKTRMQSDPSKYKSLLPATATIIKEEGAGALVKGLGPTLVGYGIEGAMKFGVYEVCKPLVLVAMSAISAKLSGGKSDGNNASLKGLSFLLASIAAGAVASLILVPMESTRIRMVTDPSFEGVNLVGGLSRLVEEAGLIQTLTMGLGAMLAKQVRYCFHVVLSCVSCVGCFMICAECHRYHYFGRINSIFLNTPSNELKIIYATTNTLMSPQNLGPIHIWKTGFL